MKKLVVGSLVIGLLLVCGCTLAVPPPANTPPTSDITTTPDTAPGNGGITITPAFGGPPEDATWISPVKVHVGNFYPGARAEYPVTVHNNNDTETSFLIAYRIPGHVDKGYIKATEEVRDWVVIVDAISVLMPKETREVLVILEMPKGAEAPGSKWEFWVGVRDTTQTGMVQTEPAVRWLVEMK